MNRALLEERRRQHKKRHQASQQARAGGKRRIGVHRHASFSSQNSRYKKQLHDHLYELLSLVQEMVHGLLSPEIGSSGGTMTVNWLKGAKWLLMLISSSEPSNSGSNQLYVNPRNGSIQASHGNQPNIWRKDFEFNGEKQKKNLSFANSVYQ
jgi:hypothetical protein